MSYFDEGGTLPPPFNIIPSPKSFLYLGNWFNNTFCPKRDPDGRRRRHNLRSFTVRLVKIIFLFKQKCFLPSLICDTPCLKHHRITPTYTCFGGLSGQGLLCHPLVLIFRNISRWVGCWETTDITSLSIFNYRNAMLTA